MFQEHILLFDEFSSATLERGGGGSPTIKVEKPNSHDAMSSPYPSVSCCIDRAESSLHTSLPYPDAHTIAHMMLL